MAEMMSLRWLRTVTPDLPEHPYAVNLGSWDGFSFNDPVYPLFAAGFRGVAVEWGDPPELAEHLGGFPGVTLRPRTYLTPASVCRVLAAAGCPTAPEFLKIDIDGMDGDVLQAVLAGGYRPGAIQAEVNPEIPPPLAFNAMASEHLRPGGPTGFFGMSLQYAVDLLAGFDYVLVDLDFQTEYTHDALFLPRGQLGQYAALDARAAFLAAPPVLPHILGASTAEKMAWRTRADRRRVAGEVWTAMLDASHRKHGNNLAPFTLYIAQ